MARPPLHVVSPLRLHPEPVLDEGAHQGGGQVDAAVAPLDVDLLFRRYAPYVAAVALRLLGRDDEVEDVVQDVFVQALRDLSQLREPRAVKGWLAALAVHTASKRLRRRRLRSFLGLDRVPRYEELVAPGATAEQRTLLSRIYTRLDELPTPQRVAWVLRYLEGEPLDSVAQICSCSLATAKRRIASVNSALERTFADD